ncbi:astacin-like metalloprotease toxin 3 [Lepeophtheirus salmonis]|uniref:astacin-like metalloprotease toxin 3 n=1 Tax=Lepeophtheirus salmonis TaxID=72036 RepID=UPI001AEB55B8|nr:high choriolytic enzyme 1-like [Lepeophtheirus salmonis]XP_040582333.1 high choriolytic enzyme 1-like [Lepeophtheirus salmonis]XP_040583731.1 high choriolytic enzyme 1-like [Lepeophtheirus salmonis]XP_040583732.1 high choriolytic enzyme 1-like [Lepeophtheirus salmonis]XP_040583733.1 high choriolytic enzyme 1-like [Lepeophtheirus salmonis]
MMIISLVLVLSLFLGSSSSSKLENPGCRIIRDKYDRQDLASRNYLSDERKHWPNKEVPYTISNSYPPKYNKLLRKAMKAIESMSCVKWIPRTNQRNYVYISPKQSGCFANLGYDVRRGKHTLNLQMPHGRSTCMILGIAMHEMLHILGVGHEQCRPDRDSYVKVHWRNMENDKYNNYFKSIGPKTQTRMPVCDPQKRMDFDRCWSGYRTNTFGFAYDYQSLMHYGLNDFTQTGYPTMSTKKSVPSGIKIGQRIGMTRLDVSKLNAAYKCQDKTDPPHPPHRKTTRKVYTYGPTSPRCWDEYPEWCEGHNGLCYIGYFYMKENCALTCEFCDN